MREIAVHEFKKVPRNCSTCLYGGGIGCGNANVGKACLAYPFCKIGSTRIALNLLMGADETAVGNWRRGRAEGKGGYTECFG